MAFSLLADVFSTPAFNSATTVVVRQHLTDLFLQNR